jgi:hypothetical protein
MRLLTARNRLDGERSDPEWTLRAVNCRIAKSLFDHLIGAGEDRLRNR